MDGHPDSRINESSDTENSAGTGSGNRLPGGNDSFGGYFSQSHSPGDVEHPDVSYSENSLDSQGEKRPEIPNIHSRLTSLPGSHSNGSEESEFTDFHHFSQTRVWVSLATILILNVISLISLNPLCTQYFSYRIARDKYNISFNNVSSSGESKCGGNVSDDDNDVRNSVQREASGILLYASLWTGIPAFFTCLVVGSYSDFIGRKPLVLASTIALMVKVSILCLIIGFDLDLTLWYLASLVDGCVGSLFSLTGAMTAIMADVTPRASDRATRFAALEGTILVFSATAQVAVGYMIEALGFIASPIMFVALLLVAVLVAIFVLPETMHTKKKLVLNPLVHLKKTFGFYMLRGSSRLRLQYSLGLVLFFFTILSIQGRLSVETLFVLNAPICWDSVAIGIFNCIRMVVWSFATVILLRGVKGRLSLEVTGVIGCVSATASFVFEGFANNTASMYFAALIGIFFLVVIPLPKAMLSQITSPAEQGALFSSMSSVEALASMFSLTLYTTIYNASLSTYKGTVFQVMAAVCLVIGSLLIAYRSVRRSHDEIKPGTPVTSEETPLLA